MHYNKDPENPDLQEDNIEFFQNIEYCLKKIYGSFKLQNLSLYESYLPGKNRFSNKEIQILIKFADYAHCLNTDLISMFLRFVKYLEDFKNRSHQSLLNKIKSLSLKHTRDL